MCSTWLASLDPQKGKGKVCKFFTGLSDLLFSDSIKIPVWVVPGTISFPRKPESHVIMVGPGTGCAPFRAYIEERLHNKAKGKTYDFDEINFTFYLKENVDFLFR